jgi:hypothetical protein
MGVVGTTAAAVEGEEELLLVPSLREEKGFESEAICWARRPVLPTLRDGEPVIGDEVDAAIL